VSVTNGMSSTSSWLCPDVTVIGAPGAAAAPVCQPSAAIANATTRDNPRTSQRSDAVTITATSRLQVRKFLHRTDKLLLLLFNFFDPGTQFPGNEEITLCNTKSTKIKLE